MTATGGDTGNGATFTRTGMVFDIVSITCGEQTIDTIDKSVLDTTGFAEKIAADLADAGDVTVEYIFNSVDAGEIPTIGGAAASTTITWPIGPATPTNTTGATLIGTGIITGVTPPSFINNELQKGSVTVTFDGVTGPAFVAESA